MYVSINLMKESIYYIMMIPSITNRILLNRISNSINYVGPHHIYTQIKPQYFDNRGFKLKAFNNFINNLLLLCYSKDYYASFNKLIKSSIDKHIFSCNFGKITTPFEVFRVPSSTNIAPSTFSFLFSL